jgi:hypothetical protein
MDQDLKSFPWFSASQKMRKMLLTRATLVDSFITSHYLFFFFFLCGAAAHIGPWPPLYEVP